MGRGVPHTNEPIINKEVHTVGMATDCVSNFERHALQVCGAGTGTTHRPDVLKNKRRSITVYLCV